jgi:hypothetical protein
VHLFDDFVGAIHLSAARAGVALILLPDMKAELQVIVREGIAERISGLFS